MLTLDQIKLLEKRVESAVEKIQQLKTENDALRRKCAELTNSLSVKTEQILAFETDETKIEEGIINALNKLSSIEAAVIQTATSTASDSSSSEELVTKNQEEITEAVTSNTDISSQEIVEENSSDQLAFSNEQKDSVGSEDNLETNIQENNNDEIIDDSTNEDDSSSEKFDIF